MTHRRGPGWHMWRIAADVGVPVATPSRPGGPTDAALEDALAEGQTDRVAER
jgi:hypothetical protein